MVGSAFPHFGEEDCLRGKISPHTYVNIMDQHYPAGKVSSEKYPEINRRIDSKEHKSVQRIAEEEGLYRFDTRRSNLESSLFELDPTPEVELTI